MFKDDQMLPLLTGVVVMLAVGTFLQKSDAVMAFFTGGEAQLVRTVYETDIVETRAKLLKRIDVLANDQGLDEGDREGLVVVTRPACGQVFVQDDVIQYLADESCTRFQTIRYVVSGKEQFEPGQVQIRIAGAPLEEPGQNRKPQATPAPALPDDEAVTAELETAAELAAGPAEADPVAEEPVAALTDDLLREPAPLAGAGLPVAAAPSAAPNTAGIDRLNTRGETAPERVARIPQQTSPAPSASATDRDQSLALAPRIPATPSAAPVDRSGADGAFAAAAAPSETASSGAAPVTGGGFTLSSVEEPLGLRASVVRVEVAEPLAREPSGLAVPGEEQPQVLRLGENPGTGAAIGDLRQRRLAALGPTDGLFKPARRPEITVELDEPRGIVRRLVDLENVRGLRALRDDSFVPGEASQDETVELAALSPSHRAGPGRSSQERRFQEDTLIPAQPEEIAEETAAPEPAPVAPSAVELAPGTGTAADEPEIDSFELAALPPSNKACIVPPAVTLDMQSFARTILGISSPCHANAVAELSYSGLSLAVALDGAGAGQIEVLGFEPSSRASLLFPDGTDVVMDIPFSNANRVSRMAIAWTDPVRLDLHAMEFGAVGFSEGDVNPSNPRSLKEVRRRGGGYLASYQTAEGRGQFVQIYSHVLSRRGISGVVEFNIDYVSRDRDLETATCAGGAHAQPTFKMIQSRQGRIERQTMGRLAPRECEQPGEYRELQATNGVGSIIVTP